MTFGTGMVLGLSRLSPAAASYFVELLRLCRNDGVYWQLCSAASEQAQRDDQSLFFALPTPSFAVLAPFFWGSLSAYYAMTVTSEQNGSMSDQPCGSLAW
jgi:hypothetical protein